MTFHSRLIEVVLVIAIIICGVPGYAESAKATGTTNGGAVATRTKKPAVPTGDGFALFGYRPHQMARYITKTSQWNAGRRSILDWGCGGGALSKMLVQRGAQEVIAIDMNEKATKAARNTLRPYYPNAKVEGCKPSFVPPFGGPPGQIAYKSKFDIIVSFAGGLSYGSTNEERISPGSKTIWNQAINACKPGGCIIVAHRLGTAHNYGRIISMALSAIMGHFNIDRFWLTISAMTLNKGVISMVITHMVMTDIFESVKSRQKWRIRSIAKVVFMCFYVGKEYLKERQIIKQWKNIMKYVAPDLVNVKYGRRFSFLTWQEIPVCGGKNSTVWSRNLENLPGEAIFIIEGQKKSLKSKTTTKFLTD